MRDDLHDARERFRECTDAWSKVRDEALADLKFSRLGDQWPEDILKSRNRENRPCLTINKLPAFIRQVVNDARQNKPTIRVRPVDDVADVRTAEIINGLIRHIEATSDADVAYDTAIESAVSAGMGFFRVDIDYAHDDTFETDIFIRRINNPFTVYFDPRTEAADSSDWRFAFLVEKMARRDFERTYPGAHAGEFTDDDKDDPWYTEDTVRLAEYWDRYEAAREVALLTTGDVVDVKIFEKRRDSYLAAGVEVKTTRTIKSWKVKHTLMTGAEKLEETEWAGAYIPIIPVFGEEVNVEGKRYFRSLIRDAKDAQIMYNYWRTSATELVAMAPKAPWVGEEGAFVDPDKWAAANMETFAYLEYKAGTLKPERQAFDASPVGSMQQALSASDDMKAVIGIYDASLGQRSNETSGRAIMARQREGDTNTYHFIDNLTRAIRHAGRVTLDLIPHVYNQARIIRVLGEDGEGQPVSLMQETQQPDGTLLEAYDLTGGKYDLIVTAGPSFTSRREEAAQQMMEMGRAVPAFFEVAGDLLAKNLDWPGADELAERLKAINPLAGGQQEGPDPEIAAVEAKTKAEIAASQAKAKNDIMIAQEKAMADAKTKREVALYEAETERIVAQGVVMQQSVGSPVI
jgi:hypothetical protein